MEAVAEAGGIPSLVQMAQSGSSACKENAARALHSLAFRNDANKLSIVGAGAISALVELVKFGTVVCKENAAGALSSLRSTPPIRYHSLENSP
jgi:hypothetical protein